MGQTTPNIGIYIPAAGETGYDQSYLQGMVNIDQHDHSGGPNKGLPISTSGLADFSVTYKQLNSNVVDSSSGIGVRTGSFANQLTILGLLKSLFTLGSTPPEGFVVKNGTVASARTFQDSATVTWSNADGTAGNPSATLDPTGLPFPWTVPQGGSGVGTFSRVGDLITSGSTATGNFQQPTGVRTGLKLLQEQGVGVVPAWKSLFDLGLMQTVYMTLTATQMRNLNGTPITLVAAQGGTNIIIPLSCVSKLNYGGTPFTNTTTNVVVTWNNEVTNPALYAFNGAFAWAGSASKYSAVYQNDSFISGLNVSDLENKAVTLTTTAGDLANGTSSTVDIVLTYYVI